MPRRRFAAQLSSLRLVARYRAEWRLRFGDGTSGGRESLDRDGITRVASGDGGAMRLKKPRIAPLVEGDWTDEVRELLEPTRGGVGGGSVLNIFATLAHHPKLLKRWNVFGNHVLFKSSLPARDREILILRIGWLWQAEYEWGQHVVIGKRVGLSDEDIERIRTGPDAPGWDPFEAALVRAADELHADAFVSDATWKALAERYETRQLMDVVFTVGQYTVVSMALNTFGVQLDPGIKGF